MSFVSIAKSLAQGEIPGVSLVFAKTKINEALGYIYSETDWSFQSLAGGWFCAGMRASVGTVTVTPYSATVVGDAVASAAWAALVGRPLLTEMQFRNPSYALYSIIKYDTISNPPFGTLTLDRPWMEPVSGPGQPYWAYQAYFPVPVADFTKFIEIRDTTNNASVLFSEYSQADLAMLDPQRLIFGPTVPTYAVPWGQDTRPGSSTLGYMMYELWPHCLSLMPFSFRCRRSGPLLVNPADTVPYPLDDEVVSWRAKQVLYQWKEAQKGNDEKRGSGANWQFLAQAASKEYERKIKLIKAKDANLHRDFVTREDPSTAGSDGYSTNRTGQLNIGTFGR